MSRTEGQDRQNMLARGRDGKVMEEGLLQRRRPKGRSSVANAKKRAARVGESAEKKFKITGGMNKGV